MSRSDTGHVAVDFAPSVSQDLCLVKIMFGSADIGLQIWSTKLHAFHRMVIFPHAALQHVSYLSTLAAFGPNQRLLAAFSLYWQATLCHSKLVCLSYGAHMCSCQMRAVDEARWQPMCDAGAAH